MWAPIRTSTLLLVLLSVVLAQVAAPAAAAGPATQPAPPELTVADLEPFVDGLVTSQLETHHIPGATVAVVKDGELLFAKGYGHADVANDVPVRANRTLFRVGSVSKLVTYTTVMQGVESGDLDLDADVNSYLDDSPVEVPATYDEPVTLRHLGTHTAGFEDVYEGLFLYDQSAVQPLGEALTDTRPARVRPPGELAAYSNWGAALAGHVVAERADTPFDEYVEASVLDPLGMDRSTFRQPVPGDLADDLAIGYRYRDGAFVAGRFEYVGTPPAGSMSATATDMGRFMLAHLGEGSFDGGRILEPATVRQMHSRQFTHDDRLNGMAYGFVEQDRNGVRAIGHGGATELFYTQLLLLPGEEVGVFVSYNAPGGGAAGNAFLEAFLDRYYPGESPSAVSPSAGAADRTAALAGEFRATRVPYTSWWKFAAMAQTVEVVPLADGELLLRSAAATQFGFGATRWVELEPNVYREVDGDGLLVFRDSDDGMVLFLDRNPAAAFQQLPVHETAGTTLVVALGSLALFSLSVLGWGLLAAYRWRIDQPPWSRRTWAARGLVGLLVVLLLVLLAALNVAASAPFAVMAGEHPFVDAALAVPYLVVPVVLAIVGIAALAWRQSEWGLGTRVHYTGLALAGLVVLWELSYWNFLPV
ncbi:serine hydrolase domain-containing protein [Haloglomus litoreum]|uniref:serine hydrolase domain-containing protein n=1 Tax=Haloglomus litoreum TaxID=3034026 RepID=UPI0023E81953|nr:serine hydrolase domain-containing protein [Haloglomus sp. DT116]